MYAPVNNDKPTRMNNIIIGILLLFIILYAFVDENFSLNYLYIH